MASNVVSEAWVLFCEDCEPICVCSSDVYMSSVTSMYACQKDSNFISRSLSIHLSLNIWVFPGHFKIVP